MNEYGVSTPWHEYERAGQADAIWREKHTPSLYRVECRWWAAHLVYCASIKPWTAERWMGVVEVWIDAVERFGYGEAIFELSRLRKEMRRCVA